MSNRFARVVHTLWVLGFFFGLARPAFAQGAPPETPPAATPPAASVPVASTPPASSAIAGGPGESCRAKSDCISGLKCMGNTCRDEMEGASCGARADCGGRLACVASTCVVPGQAGSADESGPSKEWKEWGGLRPHFGLVISGGPTIYAGGLGSTTVGGFLFALKGGILIDRAELTMEFSPVTFLPYTGFGAEPVLQFNLNGGYHIPVYGPISWPLRAGVGMAAVNLGNYDALFQGRFDLVGISAMVGPVLLDLYAPSVRLFTDFSDGAAVHLNFGIGGSILPDAF